MLRHRHSPRIVWREWHTTSSRHFLRTVLYQPRSRLMLSTKRERVTCCVSCPMSMAAFSHASPKRTEATGVPSQVIPSNAGSPAPWEEPSQPYFCLSLQELIAYAQLAEASWADSVAKLWKRDRLLGHGNPPSHKRPKLCEGEFWGPDIFVQHISSSNSGVFSSGRIKRGTQVIVAAGISSESLDAFHIYGKIVELVSQEKSNISNVSIMRQRLSSFCPLNDAEADRAVSSDAERNSTSYLQSLARLLTVSEGKHMTVPDLQRLILRIDRNSFFEGVFPLASKLNHSCRPNCGNQLRKGSMRVVTIEAINPGEELTINYLGEAEAHLPTDQRRALLQKRYGFWCRCKRCDRTKSVPTIASAEARLEAAVCPSCQTGICVPVDDHTTLPGFQPPDGWKACSHCLEKPSAETAAAIDDHIGSCYSSTMSLSEYLIQDLSLVPVQLKCLYSIRECSMFCAQLLHPNHWICCRLFRLGTSLAREIALLTRNALSNENIGNTDRVRIYEESVELFAEHAKAACTSFAPILPSYSHHFAALLQNAADALRVQWHLQQEISGGGAKGTTCREADAFERRSVHILRDVFGDP